MSGEVLCYARFLYLYYHRLPTDVQAEAMPLILGGGDVLMVTVI